MSLHTVPQYLADRYDATYDELVAALASLPEPRPYAVDAATIAAVYEAARDKLSAIFTQAKFETPEYTRREGATVYPAVLTETPYGGVLIMPFTTEAVTAGWIVKLNRTSRLSMAPWMLELFQADEAGLRRAVFPGLKQAAAAGLVCVTAGTAAEFKHTSIKLVWSPGPPLPAEKKLPVTSKVTRAK
jgi:hypothetical protein